MSTGYIFLTLIKDISKRYQEFLSVHGGGFFILCLENNTIRNDTYLEHHTGHASMALQTLKPLEDLLIEGWQTVKDTIPILSNPNYTLTLSIVDNKPVKVEIEYNETTLSSPSIDGTKHRLDWVLDALSALGPGTLEARLGSVKLAASGPEEALLAHYIFKHPQKLFSSSHTLPSITIEPNPETIEILKKSIGQSVHPGPLFSTSSS